VKFHPLCERWPLIEGAARDAFDEDIRRHGVLVPVVTHRGLILDGRNRWLACQRLGITCPTRECEGDDEALDALVRSLNLHRRHLNDGQYAFFALELVPRFAREAKDRQRGGRGGKLLVARLPQGSGRSRDHAAAAMGVSPRYVAQAGAVRQHDARHGTDFEAQVRAGAITLPEAQRRMRTALRDADGTDHDASLPALPVRSITKPGDLWVLGRHRLLCGDATAEKDVLRVTGGRRAACLWSDPPFGVEYVGKTGRALRIAHDDAAGLPALLRAAFTHATRVLVPGSPFYVVCPTGSLALEFELALRDVGWRLHQHLVWVKDGFVAGHADYHRRHELLLYGWTPGPGRSGRGNHKGSRWYGDDGQDSVFEFDRPRKSDEHPTQKPVALVARCLGNSTREDDIVVDPFCGSGTTILACEDLGRACCALEIDPRYCDVAVARWEQATGQKAQRRAA
jgi:DNA modification methylase